MEWLRKWLWKIAILALPWQTRWIWHVSQTPEAGYQTEWGIYAIYGSWLLILATWVASLGLKTEKVGIKKTVWIAGCLMLTPMLIHPTWYMWQWMAQWTSILMLADAFRRLQIERGQIVTWFLWSLMPHVGLAFLQVFEQQVRASTWLGMAAQEPARSGVSVIGPSRFLRAYAGFPHPNIAGMWLVFGLAAALWRLYIDKHKSHAGLTYAMLALLSSALVMTFSRTAWLSAGMLLCAGFVFATQKSKSNKKYWPIALVMISMFLTALPLKSSIVTRASYETHLEQNSIREREQAWKGIWSVLRESSMIGFGVGNAALIMQAHGLGNQPPHALPLAVMLELGILGLAGLALLTRFVWKTSDDSNKILLILLIFPALIDHYLWTIWAGQMLIGLLIIWWTRQGKSVDKRAKT